MNENASAGEKMGLYDGLERFLSRANVQSLELSFDEIAKAVGRSLPKRAYSISFWENPSNRAQYSGIKRSIRGAGYQGELVEGTARVRFVKTSSE